MAGGRRRGWTGGCGAAAGAALGIALLLLPVAAAHASALADQARALIETQPLPGADVEILVGEPDPRLELAACRRAEPFVPPGARLWGKTSLGVRCVEGATWTVYLPAQIRVYAPGPVAARPIARGQVVGADDIRQERIELTQFPPGALAGVEPLEGRIALRQIAAGEPLRRDFLRAPVVVQAGDLVRVVAAGAGFAVTTEGKALTMGADGQTVQAAVPGGRVVTGVARSGKLIEVR